jgi:hypothetical protein
MRNALRASGTACRLSRCERRTQRRVQGRQPVPADEPGWAVVTLAGIALLLFALLIAVLGGAVIWAPLPVPADHTVPTDPGEPRAPDRDVEEL